MSILSEVKVGSKQEGIRIVISGVEKIGKTTLSTSAPDALLIPLEVGYSGVTVAQTQMLQEFWQVFTLLQEILAKCYEGTFKYRTIIFDSATALERQIHSEVIKMDASYVEGNTKAVTIDSALGGYGKAYSYANTKFETFLQTCDQLAVYYGINIILTCHVFASKLIDPIIGEYDSWELLLHSPKNGKVYGKRELITQWADIVGFLYEPFFVTKGNSISKGIDAKKGHMLGLSRTPSYVAGNRFGLFGEIEIPKEDPWNHFAKYLYDSSGIDLFNRDKTTT